jgi:hypothetical protein
MPTQCAVPRPEGSDPGLVGTAVGYVLTAHLQPGALVHSFAVRQAPALDRMWRQLQPDASGAARRAVERIHKLSPAKRQMGEDEWGQLCRLALVLARLEQGRRSVAQVGGFVVSELSRSRGDLDAFVDSFASPATLVDLAAVGRVAVDDYIELRDALELHIGPTFAQSAALGGADADVVYDGHLLDFKSSAETKVISRRDVWQLAGYLLADTQHTYGIHTVGIGALRWRRRLLWPVQEFLGELSGSDAPLLSALRAEFRELLGQPSRGPAGAD